MKIKKIAVIGGTGKSGKYLVKHLVERGFHIKLLLRNSAGYTDGSGVIEVVRGDARDYNAIASLVDGCDAVISTLGQPKGFRKATENVIKAMAIYGLSRYIVITGLSVASPFDSKSERVRFATEWMYKNYPETTKDKQAEYNLLVASSVDWTLVRLPLIVQTEESFPVKVSLEDCPGETVSAADLSNFLTDQLTDRTYIRRSPFLANI